MQSLASIKSDDPFLIGATMGCRQGVPAVLPVRAIGANFQKINRPLDGNSCVLDLSIVNSMPGELLTHMLSYLSVEDVLHLEAATPKIPTEGAWKLLCAKRNLRSRSTYRCVGSIIITNRPGRSLSWKDLFVLDCKSPSPRRYLSYKDSANQKYVVFVNE